jgi:ribonucleoside-diphosphate reductase alpha chain
LAKWTELNHEVKVLKDGAYQLEKDKEAVYHYFVDYVNKNTVFFHDLSEKLAYLLDNDYYDAKVFNKYSFAEIKKIYKKAYSYKFRFKSYMAAVKFYENYALKTNDGARFLERYEDRVSAVALTLGDGNFDLAMKLTHHMMTQNYQPATPTYLNASRKRSGKHVSCFILDTPDSTEGIQHSLYASAQLSRQGGGVGIGLSKLRARNEPIKGVENCAGGPVGVAKMLENTFLYFDQLGQRNGSGVAYLSVFHSDIDEFLDTKRINVDDNIRLKTLSIGVLVPDKFMELVKSGEAFYTFAPYSVFKTFGVNLDEMDMNEWYDKLVDSPTVKKTKKDARKLITKMAQVQQESGYPYVIFIDNANNQHALSEIGRIKNSNLCTEIFELSEPSDIKGYGSAENEWGSDISCVLGSLNIANILETKQVEEAIKTAIYGLNTVVNQHEVDAVPSVTNGNKKYRAIGLGIMNLHGYLAKNRIIYGSKESVEFADILGAIIRYHSIKASVEYAKEHGVVFEDFEKSDYSSGKAFDKYFDVDMVPSSEKVAKLFDGVHIPTSDEWADLWVDCMLNGMANGYLNAIAPTGSISYLQNATASAMPITDIIETRTYGDLTSNYPMPFLDEANGYYVPAYDMEMRDMLDVIAALQKHVDQGISTTLFMKSTATTKDLVKLYMYAWSKGLKSLYYTRTKVANVIDECEACSI